MRRANDLAEPIPWRDFRALNRLSPIAGAIAEAGIVGENAVYCITPIVNGEVRVEDTLDAAGDGAVPDYLKIYWTEGGFDLPQLINDDYFEAIHLPMEQPEVRVAPEARVFHNRHLLPGLQLGYASRRPVRPHSEPEPCADPQLTQVRQPPRPVLHDPEEPGPQRQIPSHAVQREEAMVADVDRCAGTLEP